jgi:thioesterase domain-containing protein
LSRYLGSDQPYYAVIPDLRPGGAERGLGPSGVAAHCVAAIRAIQPRGPYFLSGISVGGVVAFHIAQQFAAAGESVGLLALIDTHFPGYPKRNFAGLLGAIDLHLGNLVTRPRSQRLKYVLIELRSVLRRVLHLPPPPWDLAGAALYTGLNEMPVIEPQPYPGRIVMLFAEESTHRGAHDGRMQWSKVAQQGLEVCIVPGGHSTMTGEPHVRELARALRRYLDAGQTVAYKSSPRLPDGCDPVLIGQQDEETAQRCS